MTTTYFLHKTMIVVIILITAFSSCTKDNSIKPDNPLPVVESYLAPGQPASVNITQEILYGSTSTPVPITGLAVEIIHSGQQYILDEVSPGRYQSSSLPVTAGGKYHLSFLYNGSEVRANTEVPLSPGIVTASAPEMIVPQISPGVQIPEPIRFTWQNPDQEYHLMVVKNMETDPTPITFNVGDNVIEKPDPAFRIPPHKGSEQQLSLGRFSFYGRHAVILYRIWPEYAALYENNSNNSIDLQAPPTNIENGLGIFTGVHPADTLWVQVR